MTANASSGPIKTFAEHLARRLIEEGRYKAGTVPAARPLSSASDYVLTGEAGLGVIVLCIVDRERDPQSVALGALNRHFVVQVHEWQRLLTSALLHADPTHLLGNSLALFWSGLVLERFIGRLWFGAFFVVGAVSGSIMSLLVNPTTLVSVGASGAITCLCIVALLVSCLVSLVFLGTFLFRPLSRRLRRPRVRSISRPTLEVRWPEVLPDWPCFQVGHAGPFLRSSGSARSR